MTCIQRSNGGDVGREDLNDILVSLAYLFAASLACVVRCGSGTVILVQ
jgi:hypothetical protein